MGQCESDWDIVAVGHNDLVEVGNELWNVYHSYEVYDDGMVGGRFLCADKVVWVENDLGQKLLYTNGPSTDVQPLPEIVSGYTNVATKATVKATGKGSENAQYLNDGIISMYGETHIAKEFVTTSSSTTITLTFDDWVSIRAIMVYNASAWEDVFSKVERIEFDTKHGTAYINNLGFDIKRHQVSYEFLALLPEEIESGEYDLLRPAVASIAEFNEMDVKEVRITLKKGKGKKGIGVSEIYLLGKSGQ